MTREPITLFFGDYRWLSNFYLTDIMYDGFTYPSVEHAYIAAKSTVLTKIDIKKLLRMTPGQAKRFGRNIKLRTDWEEVKIEVMTYLLGLKFEVSVFKAALKSTRGSLLVEGNTWGDRFWGQDPVGTGKNHLGKILMDIRDDVPVDS